MSVIKENDNIDLLDVIYQKITSDVCMYNKTDLYGYMFDKEKDLLSKSMQSYRECQT